MSIEQLVYISRSSQPLTSPLDVADILEQASRNNPFLALTGVLTWSGDTFVQLLEGPSDALDVIMAKLLFDPRHSDIDILAREPVSERTFPEWSLVFAMFTPRTGADLTKLLQQERRALPAWRKVLQKMAKEQARTLAKR